MPARIVPDLFESWGQVKVAFSWARVRVERRRGRRVRGFMMGGGWSVFGGLLLVVVRSRGDG